MLVRFLETVRLRILKGNTETLCRYERGQERDLEEEVCRELAKKKVRFYPVHEKGPPVPN